MVPRFTSKRWIMAVTSKAARKPSPRPARPGATSSVRKAGKPVAKPKTSAKRPAKPAPRKAAPKPATKAAKAPVRRPAGSPPAPAKRAAAARKSSAKPSAPKRTTPRSVAPVAMTLHKPVAPYGLNKEKPSAKAVVHRHEKGLTSGEKKTLRAMMVAMRERLVRQVVTLKQESLQQREEIVTSEDGTDAFDRQFALTVASSEQDAIIDIDDALRRLDAGTYGVCEACGCDIEKPRLKALPFVRLCIRCQSETERSRPRFRPLE